MQTIIMELRRNILYIAEGKHILKFMFNETIYYILDYERDINDPNLIRVISINIRFYIIGKLIL